MKLWKFCEFLLRVYLVECHLHFELRGSQVLDITLQYKAALVKQRQLIAGILQLAQGMARDNRRGLPLQDILTDQGLHQMTHNRVQTIEGLIQEEVFRMRGQRQKDCRLPLHARILPHRLAVEQDFAAISLIDAAEKTKECGFSRAVGAYHAIDTSRRNRTADLLQRLVVLKMLADLIYLNHALSPSFRYASSTHCITSSLRISAIASSLTLIANAPIWLNFI